MPVLPFRWRTDCLDILDQRLLPNKIKFIPCRSPEDISEAIRRMVVRGAPAIGCCAAYGMALALKNPSSKNPLNALRKSGELLKSARPTAVNLAWAVDKMKKFAGSFLQNGASVGKKTIYRRMVAQAQQIAKDDVSINKAMGRHGARLLKKKSVVLTHCNTGSLATAGHGTALGVIREAHVQGKIKKVFVDETRPYLQGARLTAWELVQENIPHELITDSMAAFFMKKEKVQAIFVGCDRVASNGDTANKIGTYGLAVLAKYHHVPFYVVMPTSTLDLSLKSGKDIPIEERSSDEVTQWGGTRIAPMKTRARHPAFDVTPAHLITAIVTEVGVVRPPYKKNLNGLL